MGDLTPRSFQVRTSSLEPRSQSQRALQQRDAVGTAARRDPALDNMGTTLVAAVVRDDEVRWISVGDSPFYRAARGRLERLNADHSMVPQIEALAERGIITADEAAHHPGRHTLREAVMGQPLTLIDEGRRGLEPGDRLLVCSDGIETLGHAEIVNQAARPVQALIDAVLAVGALGQDNVTVIRLEREV